MAKDQLVLRGKHETLILTTDVPERLTHNLSGIIEAISPAVVVGESGLAEASVHEEASETTVRPTNHLAVVVDRGESLRQPATVGSVFSQKDG